MNYEPTTVDEYYDLLSDETQLDVKLVQVRKDYKVIQVNTPDPKKTRKELVEQIGPKLGIEFVAPRKTKAAGYTLEIPTDGEPVVVRLRRGGDFRRGRQNEVNLQTYIRSRIERDGECLLKVSDNYGKTVELDIVEVMDSSASHGKANRADTTVRLSDGTTYGISQKKTNASFVAKVTRVLANLIFRHKQVMRQYAKANGLKTGDYMNVRVTNRDFIDLCWFGTDISTGAVFIGDFEDISSDEIHIERIIEQGDRDVLDSFPIYTKWSVENSQYTIALWGVFVNQNANIVKDVELAGINAPLPQGRNYKLEDEPKKKRRRRRKRRTDEDQEMVEEARKNDMWDTIAWCAENHKMVWLKYQTVDEGEIVSRKVAPYSYRTRNTKVRGRATYFYAEDFTPGEERGIKCFLVDNCLRVKESKQSFTPRWPVEIKQEIDRLEQKRREDDEKKDREEKERQEREQQRKQDGIVDNGDEEEIKVKAKATPAKEPAKKPLPVKPKPEPKKPEPKKIEPKVEPAKDEPVKNVEPPKPQPKKEPEPQKKETPPTQNTEKQDVVVTDKPDENATPPPKEGEVKVTDADGNEVEKQG